MVGLMGCVGGIAALCGNRRLAPLAYVMAAVYILGFPVGTILSFVMLTGLSRYLDSSDKLNAAYAAAWQEFRAARQAAEKPAEQRK
jgi:hypothetical protein